METSGKPHPLTIPSDANLPQRDPAAPAPGASIASHYRYCFGCGVDHPSGLHISFTALEGLAVSAIFELTGDHQGAPGIAHGGLLGLAMDEALGATNALIRVPAVTAHLEVSYRLPVPIGSTVFITAEIQAQRGRKVWATATGRLNAPDGPVAVVGGSLFMQVPIEHFTTHGRSEYIEAAARDPQVRDHVASMDVAP